MTEIKSDDFLFQLFWYCLYTDYVNIELKFLNLKYPNMWQKTLTYIKKKKKKKKEKEEEEEEEEEEEKNFLSG